MCTKRRGGFALICLLFICSQLPVYYCLCCCFAFDCPKPLFVNLFLSVLQLFLKNIQTSKFNWYFSTFFSHIFYFYKSNGVKLMEGTCLFMRKRLLDSKMRYMLICVGHEMFHRHMWYFFQVFLILSF